MPLKKAKPWTPAQAKFAIENQGKMTMEAIGKIIGRSRRAVTGFLDRHKKKPVKVNPPVTYDLIDMRPNQCRWMDNEGRYCCDNDRSKKSYCSEHHYKVYVRNEKK